MNVMASVATWRESFYSTNDTVQPKFLHMQILIGKEDQQLMTATINWTRRQRNFV